METLFPEVPIYPEGFSYYPDFLTTETELLLLSLIKKVPLNTFHFHGYEAKRKVVSYGFDYNFDTKSLVKGKDIPGDFQFLINHIAQFLNLDPEIFCELLITEYPLGAVINWHRDAFPFDLIAGVSLQADCIFKLRPQQKAKQSRNSVISLPVRRRSLYVLKDKVRYSWQHSIAPVKETRYSITLRTIKRN